MKRRFSSVRGNTFIPLPTPRKTIKPLRRNWLLRMKDNRVEEMKKTKPYLKERTLLRRGLTTGDALKLLQIAVDRKAKSWKSPT